MVVGLGKSAHYEHRQVDEQPTKKSKKDDDKSAVAMLKKGDWHERRPVTDQGHDRSGQPDKKSVKKLERRSSQRRSSNARQLGCVFQDMTPPKSILQKSTDMQRPIQRVKFTKAIARHTKIRDQNPSLGYICPGEPHERSPKRCYGKQDPWRSVVADDRSGQPDKLSSTDYSKLDHDRAWSSQEWKSEVTAHDRSGQPQEVADSKNFVMGSDAA